VSAIGCGWADYGCGGLRSLEKENGQLALPEFRGEIEKKQTRSIQLRADSCVPLSSGAAGDAAPEGTLTSLPIVFSSRPTSIIRSCRMNSALNVGSVLTPNMDSPL